MNECITFLVKNNLSIYGYQLIKDNNLVSEFMYSLLRNVYHFPIYESIIFIFAINCLSE